jgi:hypothetical protein
MDFVTLLKMTESFNSDSIKLGPFKQNIVKNTFRVDYKGTSLLIIPYDNAKSCSSTR